VAVSFSTTVATLTAFAICLLFWHLQLEQLRQEFSQQPPNLQYPSYYTVPFHSYDYGNLNWQVGHCRQPPATYSLCRIQYSTYVGCSSGCIAAATLPAAVLVCVRHLAKLHACIGGSPLSCSSQWPSNQPCKEKHCSATVPSRTIAVLVSEPAAG
jgi:hypothetical protein